MAEAADDDGFARQRRTLGLAWLALLALLALSLGSAYLKLGTFNLVAGLAIGAAKTALVAWLFMRLRDAGPLVRLAAAIGLCVFGVMLVLTGVDYLTRQPASAAVQRPEAVDPWLSRR